MRQRSCYNACMAFDDLRDAALQHLPPLGKKHRRKGVAALNVTLSDWRFAHRPDLWSRWLKLRQAEAARAVRVYGPHDPNRLPD